jgi:hypothetical protein
MYFAKSSWCRRCILLLVICLLLFSAVIAQAATLTVTNTGDSGPGTLRQAIADAMAGDTIDFSLPAGSVIGIMSGLIIDKNLTISGPGAPLLRVQNINADIGQNRFGILTIPAGDFNVSISGITITGGNASGSGAGGIFNQTNTLTITGCAVSGNGVRNRAGGGIANFGTMIITNCTIADNASTGGLFVAAGGIYNRGTVTIMNSTISGNASFGGYGGGIWNDSQIQSGQPPPSCTVNITNTTIAHNSSDYGGGIYNSTGGTVNASNTIIATNTAGFSSTPDLDGALISQGHNFIGDDSGATITSAPGDQIGTGASPKDPILGPLRDNGGPTLTQGLLTGSTAIGAGDDATAPPRDQRGYLRSGVSDIGAFEFAGTIPVTLANASTRLRVQTGDNLAIGGFIITGTDPKKVLLRAVGPSLSLADQLADPILELRDSSGQTVAANDNWVDSPNKQAITNSTLAPKNNLESAILLTLTPGAYTASVRGVNNTTGIGLVEVYDMDRTVNSKLANISTRGLVQTGDNVLIGGVIVAGADPQRVIVRALGPSINVTGHLLDPTLELHDSDGALITSNDNWRSDQEAEILATTIPPPNDAESAIVRTLLPGSYTAIIRGVNGTTGIALVEVYAIK